MPITPLFEYTQDEDGLEILVQVGGASKSKADVFATDSMIKVNCSPYLLLIDLHGIVDDSKTVVTISQEGILFRLLKNQKGLWSQLEATGEKDEILKRRNSSIDRAHERVAAVHKQRLERKQKEDREATERQIELERKRRQEMENRKKQELEDERRQLEDWQKNISSSKTMASAADMSKVADDSDYESDGEAAPEVAAPASGSQTMPDHPDYHGKGWRASNTNHNADGGVQTWSEGRGVASKVGRAKKGAEEEGMSGDEEFDDAVKKDQAVAEDSEINEELEVDQQWQVISFKPLPPPRMRLEPVRVDFTKLETGHLPARENREEEIRLYKKSIKNDRQLLSDSADVSDRQPAFLKDKGDALYKQGNFRGAINAYSRALEMDPESGPAVWSNAAACFLQLGEYEPCISNCNRALDMLIASRKTRFESGDCEAGEAEKYKKQVVRALVRRGKAKTSLGLLQEAESDYVEALRYAAGSTDDLSIATDLEEVRAAMGPMDAAALKQRGSSRFQAQDYEGAMEAFTLLLGMPSAMVQDSERLVSFSNRAACFLVLERYEDSVRDCSEAIKLALESLKSKADEVATWRPQQAAADAAQNPVASSSTATTTDTQSRQGSSEKAAETTVVVTSAGADSNSTAAAATVSRDGIEIDGIKGSLTAGGEINRRNSLLSDELLQHPQMNSCGLERSTGSEEILVLERSYHWSSGVLLIRTLVEEGLPSSSDPQDLNAWTGKICSQKSVIVATTTTTGQDSDSGGGIISVTTSSADASSMSTFQDLVEGWLAELAEPAGDRAAHSKYHDSASNDAAVPSRSGGSTSYPLSAAVILPHDLLAMRQQCHTAEAYLSSGIKQLSRLLARRGAAQGHLKCFQEGCLDYESAANLARICGDDEIRCEQLGHDAEKLRKFVS